MKSCEKDPRIGSRFKRLIKSSWEAIKVPPDSDHQPTLADLVLEDEYPTISRKTSTDNMAH